MFTQHVSQVKQEHFGGLIFLVLAIVAEKFDVKVSFRLGIQ